eukprot:CAMPEP_0206170582 /NCGR_PEP_ID=MMETSP1474-20131121/39598_1 /ASSEMBLY_ACC=CAM_ASM_001110 /TAXON_ID=97495 /ORGANISM="Imantonia sp., Strain RCC918" /LENGTH=98 /DNA_ID=CAMNT_0053577395 /DNA_START=91 /DNA_END=385 /DNA_ORIENTATION=+
MRPKRAPLYVRTRQRPAAHASLLAHATDGRAAASPLDGAAGSVLDGRGRDVVVLVVVPEVEPRAHRHLPHFGRRDDVAVVVGQRRDDDNLRLEEDGGG